MKREKQDDIRDRVRERYAEVTAADRGCCCGDVPCSGVPTNVENASYRIGYTPDELCAIPEGANMGLGCGNPLAIAELVPGETVVDLGSGGGLDCFLAAKQVGESGKVIGIDMTAKMVKKASVNAKKGGYRNVEFRLGEIEHLPVPDESADVIISNCVINLSPDKPQVFRDAFRVLRKGGRLAVSDVAAIGRIPDEVRRDLDAYCGCVAGAASVLEVEQMLLEAGFLDVSVEVKDESRDAIKDWFPDSGVEKYVRAALIMARKPCARGRCDSLAPKTRTENNCQT